MIKIWRPNVKNALITLMGMKITILHLQKEKSVKPEVQDYQSINMHAFESPVTGFFKPRCAICLTDFIMKRVRGENDIEKHISTSKLQQARPSANAKSSMKVDTFLVKTSDSCHQKHCKFIVFGTCFKWTWHKKNVFR